MKISIKRLLADLLSQLWIKTALLCI